ncbi:MULTISPECIES: hypothetical protein [Nostoc]|uniref:Uncharacterized protein n=1 Tax=Nostoc paludosum FACHB-159 TaxID=2692908 RepID=A0ABR8K3Y3_9NOSO|nr:MULTISPECIES: hypothetical protein [Nostoc]MBD2677313.1 hypothetical protein [Nostoc sp. FACHB-857]MBD2732877.1 hypothetical protein [Nostoc paludosum FACHB-159]
MQLSDLANFLAILTIVDSDSKIAEYTVKLAQADTVANTGDTDTTVLKEIKKHLPELQKELDAVQQNKLELKEKVIKKILTPDK